MKDITTIGLDTAKSVFQVHGIDGDHQPILRRQLKRRQVLPFFTKLPPCVVGIEACSASHHWSRELTKLGHTVRLIPPRYVKPYVKSQKNDATDAEAICEAVTRPSMRFVATKSREQQAMLMLHRTRHLLIRQRTATINALRAHLVEFGIAAGIGRNGVEALIKIIADENDDRVPAMARECLIVLGAQLETVKGRIRELDAKIMAAHRASELSQRLEAIPGVGPRIATALVASIADPKAFKSGRQMAAWIGLVPKQNSSGGKEKLGGVTKAGDRYLRSMLMIGALSVIKRVKQLGYTRRPWLAELMARRPVKVAAIAYANKIIRMVWAMMVRGERYREPVAMAA